MSRRHGWHAQGATLEDTLARLCGSERARIAQALAGSDARSIEDLLLARAEVDAIDAIDWLMPEE
jgi:hypothetical protein